MAATVTLATTTLAAFCQPGDTVINVGSTAGLTPGTRLWIDRELMSVVSLGIQTMVNVKRGVDGTTTTKHDSASTITIGRGDQFYNVDPTGHPPEVVPVVPYINILNGNVWYPEGDELPVDGSQRWWQLQQPTYGPGALGVRVTTQNPTAST
jgi:hypothetical protein